MNTDSENMIMITELECIIKIEQAKSEEERDKDLIDDCIREIAELRGVKSDFSDEEIAGITDKLTKIMEKEKKRKRFIRFAAGIAALFVLVSGVTACAMNQDLMNWLYKIAKLPLGSSFNINTVVYTNQGNEKQYHSVEELLKNENLDIYYPTMLPQNVYIVRIDSLKNGDVLYYAFTFSDSNIQLTVEKQFIEMILIESPIYEIASNGLDFNVYLDSDNDCYFALAEDEGNRYTLQAKTYDEMILIIGGLKKE